VTAATCNGTFPSDARSAAGYYLDLGRVPIPVPYREKKPVRKEWQKLRPTTDDLADLFPTEEPSNIGLLLGQASNNLADVDLDIPEAVVVAPFFLPTTGWISGRNSKLRSHYWYQLDQAAKTEKYRDPIRSKQEAAEDEDDADDKHKAMIVELRGDGAQTICPPSVHETGEPIVWHVFETPARVSLFELSSAVRLIAAAALLARYWPDLGDRHDARLFLAGGLLRAGMNADKAVIFLRAVCTAAKNKDLDDCDSAVQTTAAKVKAKEHIKGWPSLIELLGEVGQRVVAKVLAWLELDGGVREWHEPIPLNEIPPAPPFPLDVFPKVIQDIVNQSASAFPCPSDYVAVPIVATAGAAIGASRKLAIKTSHLQGACVFAGVVGPPGSAKTPALQLVVEPLRDMEECLQTVWDQAMVGYEAAMEEYERALKEFKKNGGERPEKPNRPVLERITVTDTTAEALVPILKENPRGVVLVRDELIGWVQAMNQYREGGKGADQQFWLSAWSGEAVTVDRKKTHDQGPLRVRHPFICVIGGLTPDKMRLLRGDRPRQQAEQDGFIDRILLSYPTEPAVVQENWLEVSETALAELCRLVARLRSLAMVPVQEGGLIKGWRPFIVKLTSSGRQAWQNFTQTHADERNAEDFPPQLIGPWSKLRGYAGRLALILHYLRWACGELGEGDAAATSDVDGESMERAARLVAYFKAHAKKVYAAMDADPRTVDAKLVLRWLARHPELTVFSRRDAHQGLRRNTRFSNPDNLDAPLKLLEQHGYIRSVFEDWARGAGRPSSKFEVNPLWGHPRNPQYPQNSGDGAAAEASTGDSEDIEDIEDVPPQANGATPDRNGAAPPASASDGLVTQETVDVGASPSANGAGRPEPGVGVEAAPSNGLTPRPEYRLVRTDADLGTVLATIDESRVVGLDVETTGLNPRSDRVRLLQVATDHDGVVFLVDCFAVSPEPLWDVLREKTIIGHNLAFDLAMLRGLGFEPGAVADTMLMSQLVYGTRRAKQFHSLKEAVQRHLNRDLDKTEQTSDWAGTLTDEQLQYAARDAAVLLPLHKVLEAEVRGSRQMKVAEIESRCLPALTWLSAAGVGFDGDSWNALARKAKERTEVLMDQLDEAAPARPGHLGKAGAWKWSSPEQVKDIFLLADVTLKSTDDDALAAVQHPLAALLREYRSASKLASTYGPTWPKGAVHNGRLYAGWKQIGADSGRMACSAPNLQNLPHDERYRRCFVAPPGRVLVKADYSQIELRIAAKIANDQAMLDAYARGEDLHTLTAQQVLGVATVTKEQRKLAKALNFGLLYGMGGKGFRAYAQAQYGVSLTLEEANSYRDAFFKAYPDLRKWHQRVKRQHAPVTWTLADRRREIKPDEFDTVRLNSPVQGTGADGLKLALALLWERRHEMPGAVPVLVVHDEIVMEVDADKADSAAEWLRKAMIDAMAPLIAPVPVEVEVKVGQTWGGE
jgi:DNA polymerase-1